MSEHKGLTPDASWVDEVNGPLNAAGHRDWSPDCELPTEARRGGDGIDWSQEGLGCPGCKVPNTRDAVPGHVAADPEEREEESVVGVESAPSGFDVQRADEMQDAVPTEREAIEALAWLAVKRVEMYDGEWGCCHDFAEAERLTKCQAHEDAVATRRLLRVLRVEL